MVHSNYYIGEGKDAKTAVESATSQLINPSFIVFTSTYAYFEEATQLLHEKYPTAQIIGSTGYAYSKTDAITECVAICSIDSGIEVSCNVIGDLDRFPVKHIKTLKSTIEQVHPGKDNTLCLAFMTNNQDCLTTTLSSFLTAKNIELIGATPLRGLEYDNPLGDKVSLNGTIYMNSCVYAIIKNLNGKIKVYKENIYHSIGKKMIVTKINKDTNQIIELNGKPALEEYTLVTFIRPDGMFCQKKLDCNDVICAVQMGDYKQINANTIQMIKSDFNKVSTILTIDCIFRYIAFNQLNYTQSYLSTIQSIGNHIGFITGGETNKTQSMHQTMVCAVFE